MRVVVAIWVADVVSARLVADLLQFDPVPVFILLPGSGAADLAARLAYVQERVIAWFGACRIDIGSGFYLTFSARLLVSASSHLW